MITIVQCVNSLDVGGVEQLALTLARRFQHDSFRALICCMEERGQLAEQAERDGISVHALQMQHRGKWRGFRELCRLLREHRPVVIHTHNFKPFYYGTLTRMLGVADAHVHTRHGAFTKTHRAHGRYRWLRRWADALVTVSEDGRHKLSRQSGLPVEKIGVVPNGVDTNLFCPAADRAAIRRELGLPIACPALVTAARFSPEKDLGTLLRAFARVKQAVPAAELWLLGDGAERSHLETLAQELGLTDATRFLGARADVAKFLQAADLFALSSLSEGLSIALLEAIASGLPVVATDVGGNREIVNPPEAGSLVPSRDFAALANECVRLLQDRETRQRLSQAARARALRQFSLERMLQEYEKLYLHRGKPYKIPGLNL